MEKVVTKVIKWGKQLASDYQLDRRFKFVEKHLNSGGCLPLSRICVLTYNNYLKLSLPLILVRHIKQAITGMLNIRCHIYRFHI